MPTTGIGTAAKVVITSSAPTLILSPTNTAQRLTYQLTASVQDVKGTPLSVQPTLYYDTLAGHGSATVSNSGLVSATAPGSVVVQVAASAFGATINLFTRDGLPWNAITAEQTILVTNGFILPDFYFTLSLSGSTFTIHQFAETNSTWNGTVQYTIGGKSAFPGSSNPTVIDTITGTGTATFASPNAGNNFKLQGTDATNGVCHAVYTYLQGASSPTFPQTSIRGTADGLSTSNSGQPFTVAG